MAALWPTPEGPLKPAVVRRARARAQSRGLKTDTYCKRASLVSEDVVNMSVGAFPCQEGT